VGEREAAANTLALHGAARHNPVPLKQLLCQLLGPNRVVCAPERQQRPPAADARWAADTRKPDPAAVGANPWRALSARNRAAEVSAQRGERVVRDQAGPDQLPQRLLQALVVGRSDRLRELSKEEGAPAGEGFEYSRFKI